MTAPTSLSPLPFHGFTTVLPDNATVVQAAQAPYSNTKEILLVNMDAAAGVYFRLARVKVVQAQISLFLMSGLAEPGTSTITPAWAGGPSLSAVNGPRTPGADDFNGSLAGLALRGDIIAALNDPLNSFAAFLTASAGPTSPSGVASIVITVDAAFAGGQASNGQTLTVVNGATVDFAVSPGDALSGTTQGGTGESLATINVSGANSTWLPPQTSVTLSIGSEGDRNDLGGDEGSSGYALVLRAGSGSDVHVNVTYVQNRGGAGR